MTDITPNEVSGIAESQPRDFGLKKRYAAEKRFQIAGMLAISLGILFLILLFWSIISKGYTAFEQTKIQLDIYLDEQIIDPKGSRNRSELFKAIRYNKVIEPAFYKAIGVGPQGQGTEKRPCTGQEDHFSRRSH